MGWNSYYGQTPLTEASVMAIADTLVSRGLLVAGYRYVWLDDGWWDGQRDAHGAMLAPPQQWPHGLRYLTDYLHARGLLAGIYTDAGADGCGGAGRGSGPQAPGKLDHYQLDADQFAAWGFDAVKVDFCGGLAAGLDPATQYARFGRALRSNRQQRPILLNISNYHSPLYFDLPLEQTAYWSYTFGPSIANSWRTETDVGLVGRRHVFQWTDVVRNLESDAAHPEAAGPGGWNDPDYLGPELGMSPVEDQAQFSLWAVEAAPLIIGSDVRKLSDASIEMLTNPEVIAIDQDPLGSQGIRIADNAGGQIWMRYLATPGTRAVALLNLTSAVASLVVRWEQLGLTGPAAVRDLWARADDGTFDVGVSVRVPSHGAVLLLISGSEATR